MATFEQNMLVDTADSLADKIEGLEEYADWAEGEGYRAIQHKIEEALGPLRSAEEAARQYADGRLTRSD